MPEKSLSLYQDKTFLNKLGSKLSKLLIPTKLGINGMVISIKRNNLIKAFNNYLQIESEEDSEKKEYIEKKYEEVYTSYLEVLDKHIMNSIYKKVKNETASEFEKEALANYYTVINLKEKEYVEYKYKKQKYLLELDFENIKNSNKEKVIKAYKEFYVSKMESLYKSLLKQFSIKLADNISHYDKEMVYAKIFETLEQYISEILPLKMEIGSSDNYSDIIDEYNKFDNYAIGKLDQVENLNKKVILLGISRRLFTHSLPLVVAEQCYIKLIKDTRSLIVDTKIETKREKAYNLVLNIIEDYNIKLLSTKVYWDKPAQREEYRAFWNKYKSLDSLKKEDYISYMLNKEVLFVKEDLKKVYMNENKYCKIIQFYKNKLVSLNAMRQLKNSYISKGKYKKSKDIILPSVG